MFVTLRGLRPDALSLQCWSIFATVLLSHHEEARSRPLLGIHVRVGGRTSNPRPRDQ